jgi:hypothetical protein
MPNPRKLRLASVRIIVGTNVENRIIIVDIILGRICLVRILVLEQPKALDASRYMFAFMLMVELLTILEPVIPKLSPITMITCHIPGPTIEISTIIRISGGIHIQASTILCIIKSKAPPIYALSIPIIVDKTTEMAAPINPTITEIRAP